MKYPASEEALREALEAFETALETPIVPGEFEQWSKYVQETWPVVQQELKSQVRHSHREQLAEIAAEDTEMLTRVQKIQDEDRAITAEADRLASRIQKIAELAPRLERTTAATQDRLAAELVQPGLNFVIRVKTQEVGVRTWLSEAFNRERGPVD